LPTKNEKDLVDVPKSVIEQLNLVFIDHMDEVLKHALTQAPVYAKPKKPVQERQPRQTKNKMAKRTEQS
jgi:ATP-dependent Lon protease